MKEGPSFTCVMYLPQQREYTFMMSILKRGRGQVLKFVMCLQILLLVDKQQSFTVHFCGQGVGGGTIDRFLWMSDHLRCLKDQLCARFIFNNYRSFANSLLHLVRSNVIMVFTYVKVAAVKLREARSLVMQFRKSYQVNGHQENYGHHRREVWQLAIENSCCQKDFVQE